MFGGLKEKLQAARNRLSSSIGAVAAPANVPVPETAPVAPPQSPAPSEEPGPAEIKKVRFVDKVRTLIIEDFRKAFTRCDIIAGPTVPITAFGLAEKVDDPLSLYLLDIYTIPANLAGLPAISIPCGFGDDGMPVGLQLMAPAFRDDVVLRAGIAFQDCTHFHEVRP